MRVMIHFTGGQSSETQIAVKELGYHDPEDALSVKMAVRDYVEKALNAPARPHWTWLGDVYVFSQGVSGVEPVGGLKLLSEEMQNDA